MNKNKKLNNSKYINYFILAGVIAFTLTSFNIQDKHTTKAKSQDEHPRIVNIINFIRLLEPRYENKVTEQILYQTVVNQI